MGEWISYVDDLVGASRDHGTILPYACEEGYQNGVWGASDPCRSFQGVIVVIAVIQCGLK